MNMNNLRSKGKKYERKIAKKLSAWSGLDILRTPCSGALSLVTKSDLFDKTGLFCLFVECKKRRLIKINDLYNRNSMIMKWWQKTKSNAVYEGKIPFLIFSSNNSVDFVMYERNIFEKLFGNCFDLWYINFCDDAVIMKLDDFISNIKYDRLFELRCAVKNSKRR